jgi:hypothetical protein
VLRQLVHGFANISGNVRSHREHRQEHLKARSQHGNFCQRRRLYPPVRGRGRCWRCSRGLPWRSAAGRLTGRRGSATLRRRSCRRSHPFVGHGRLGECFGREDLRLNCTGLITGGRADASCDSGPLRSPSWGFGESRSSKTYLRPLRCFLRLRTFIKLLRL